MKKMKILLSVALILIVACSLSMYAFAATYSNDCFSIEVPDGYQQSEVGNGLVLQKNNGAFNIIIQYSDNINHNNVSTMSKENLNKVVETVEKNVLNLSDSDMTATIDESKISKGKLGKYPCAIGEFKETFSFSKGESFTVYQKAYIITTKQHVYAIAVTVDSPDGMTELENIAATFDTTDTAFFAIDITNPKTLMSIAVTLIAIAIIISIITKLVKAKKRTPYPTMTGYGSATAFPTTADFSAGPAYPSYPVAPSAPSTPAYPSYPTAPSAPGTPAYPSYPTAPGAPSTPAYPSYPTASDLPNTSTTPTAPMVQPTTPLPRTPHAAVMPTMTPDASNQEDMYLSAGTTTIDPGMRDRVKSKNSHHATASSGDSKTKNRVLPNKISLEDITNNADDMPKAEH